MYLGNLPPDITKEQIIDKLDIFGTPLDVNIINNNNKRYAFVKFDSQEIAQKIIDLKTISINGHTVYLFSGVWSLHRSVLDLPMLVKTIKKQPQIPSSWFSFFLILLVMECIIILLITPMLLLLTLLLRICIIQWVIQIILHLIIMLNHNLIIHNLPISLVLLGHAILSPTIPTDVFLLLFVEHKQKGHKIDKHC